MQQREIAAAPARALAPTAQTRTRDALSRSGTSGTDTETRQPEQTDTDRENALAAAVVSAFGLSDADVQKIAKEIYEARVKAAMLAFALNLPGGTLPAGFTLDAALARSLAEQALLAAKSIAETLTRDLMRCAYAFVRDYLKRFGTYDGVVEPLWAAVSAYEQERALWKAAQIADNETAQGYSAGVDALLDDLLGETPDNLTPEDVADLDAEYGIENALLAVVPDYSSTDFCADYAGEVYPLDQADDLPYFPAHIGCIHSVVLIWPDGSTEDYAQ